MKSYSVVYSSSARSDIIASADYISNTLFDSNAANHLIDGIENATKRLKMFPESAPLSSDETLSTKGIRTLVIESYVLFYLVDHHNSRVVVVRFLHSSRENARHIL